MSNFPIGPRPPDRLQILRSVFDAAARLPGNPRVYGYDAKGHGGSFSLESVKTDSWGVPVDDLVAITHAGCPHWVRLPK